MIKAWWLGVKDGFESPSFLSMGMTWGDPRDESYDYGVNLGQRIGSVLKRVDLDESVGRIWPKN